MSAIDQITTLMETMTFAEKLSLNERIATAIRKEGGKAGAKAGGKKAKTEGEAKPKRKAAAGTLAWTAFVKHIKATQPDAFEGVTKEADKLKVVKIIREGDMAAYDAFVAEWKANYEVAQTEGEAEEAEPEAEEVVVAVPTPKPSAAMTTKEKIAAIKAAKASAPAPAPAPAKAAPAKKEVKKVKAAPAKKAKDAVKDEGAQMATLTLDDVDYWHCEQTHGLWTKDNDTFTGQNWIGYYQPGEEDLIRYTNDMGDE